MKSFKNLVNQLAEDYGAVYTFGSDSDSLGSGSYDIHNIGNPENLKRLNQYIENFTAKSYFDPRQAVVELRAKLNTVGLDINVTQESAGEGSFPVTLFGGSFGKTPQTPHNEFETSDGIVEKLGHGLQMDVEFSETGDGMIHVDAQVVPTGLDTRESVSEEEEIDEEVEETDEGVVDKIKNKVDRIQKRRSGRGTDRIADVQRARERKNTTRGLKHYNKGMDKYDADKPENENKPEVKKSNYAHDVADKAGDRSMTAKYGVRTKFGSKR